MIHLHTECGLIVRRLEIHLYSKLVFILAILLFAQLVFAASFNVNNNNPNGMGSLFQAITDLNSTGDAGSVASSNTITIDAGLLNITLTSNLPVIQKGVTINGPVAGQVIDGNTNQFNIFSTFKASLSLTNLTLQNGLAKGGMGSATNNSSGGGGGLGAGGGVFIDANQTLTLNNTTITACKAQGGAGGNGVTNSAGGDGGGGGGASWSRVTAHGVDASGTNGGGDFFGGVSSPGGVSGEAVLAGYGGGDGGVASGTAGTGGGDGAGTAGIVDVGGAGGYCGGGGGGGGSTNAAGGGGGDGGGDSSSSSSGGGGGYGSGGGGALENEISRGGGGGGGFGGGGGGAAYVTNSFSGGGGGGGWGGGGGGNGRNGLANTGSGGSFGGNGGRGLNGGSPGGIPGGGGGGAGIGGGVFVADGATLSFSDAFGSSPVSNISGNSVVAGVGGTGGNGIATDGSTAGADIFLFRGAKVLFSNGRDLSVSFAINADTAATGNNKDAGVIVSATSGAVITFNTAGNDYQGDTIIVSGTLRSIGANLPGANISTPGNLILQSGGTFSLTGGTFPTNTLVNNQSGGIINIAGDFAPPTLSINAGTINVNSGGSLTIPTTFTSTAGTINTIGTGALTVGNALSGILNNAGTTTVTAALTPAANSSNTGTINVNSGGSLTISAGFTGAGGTITTSGTGTLNVDNTLTANTINNAGTMKITGEQTINSTSFISPGIQNYTITDATTYDSLDANCPIDLNDGTVNVTSCYFGPAGTSFSRDIVTGTSIVTNANTVITPPSCSMFGMWSSSLTGNIIKISYIRESMFVTPPGVSSEIAGVLEQMSNIANPNSGQTALLNIVNSVTTQDLYDYLLENLQANTTISNVTTTMQNIGFNKIESRLTNNGSSNNLQYSSGIATGDITQNITMWVSGFGSLSKQQPKGEGLGYRAKISGGMLGVDVTAKNNDVYGAALGLSNANVYVIVNSMNITRILGYNFMLYGANVLPRNYFAEWIVSGVINKNYGVRVFGVNGTDLSTDASYRSALGGAKVNFGEKYYVNKNLDLSPIVSAQYVLVNQPSYDEYNSVAALHIENKLNQSILTLGAGARLNLNKNDELSAMLTYDAISPQQVTTANFIVGSDTFIATSSTARLALNLGANCGFNIYKNLDVRFSYNYQVRSGYYDNFGEIRLRYLF